MTSDQRTGHGHPVSPPGERPVRVKHAVLAFCAITFAFSWACWITLVVVGGDFQQGWRLGLYLLGGFGPTVGVLLMRFAVLRRPAPRLPGRLPAWRWLPFAALLGTAPACLAVLLSVPLGEGPLMSVAVDTVSATGGALLFVLVYLVAGPLSEEPGWSGFLYPHLRQSRARAHAVAVYGPLWALWHLPLFFIGGTAQNALGGGGVLHWTLTVFILAYLISSANHAGGVLAAVTVHFAYNVSQALLQMDGPAEMTIHVVLMLATCLVVARREQRTVPERPERTPITD